MWAEVLQTVVPLWLLFLMRAVGGYEGDASAGSKTEGMVVSNIAIYMATTFAAADGANASYIETRGALIATWSSQVQTG